MAKKAKSTNFAKIAKVTRILIAKRKTLSSDRVNNKNNKFSKSLYL